MYSSREKKKTSGIDGELKITVMEKTHKRLKGVENWESVSLLCPFVNKESFRSLAQGFKTGVKRKAKIERWRDGFNWLRKV